MTAGIIAAIVVGVTALLLSIPLDFTLRLGTGEQPGLRLGFRWFFGLVKKDSGGKKKQDEESKQTDLRKRARKRREEKEEAESFLVSSDSPDSSPTYGGLYAASSVISRSRA